MDGLFQQLKEYLKMDTEISYEEFNRYYLEVLDYLNQNFQQMEQDEIIKARYICGIIQSNAWDRSRRKDTHAKKFKKISEKSQFWIGAINYKLQKAGMTQEEINQLEQRLAEDN